MSAAAWYMAGGALLVFMAVAGTFLKRLPLSTSMMYLALGYLLGEGFLGVVTLDAVHDAALIEPLTEVAVLVSLFAAGLKLRVPLRDWRWILPLRLATASMAVTILLIAGVALLLGFSVGAAILLGAILAPTDPVLASDVQVADPYDRDHLRFGLTGEAGMNDGSAFPFVMLGLGLLGLHDLGTGGWRWIAVDVLWAVGAGIAVGALAGSAVSRVVLYLRKQHREAVGMEEFLALGLIGLSYGIAVSLHAYGFLAVFAAGVALRRVERIDKPDGGPHAGEAQSGSEAIAAATSPASASTYMAGKVLAFNEQMERILEVAVVVVVGTLLAKVTFSADLAIFIALLLLVIRPVAVLAGCLGCVVTPARKAMMAWFGIRGVGSLYYLAYALQHGVAGGVAPLIADYVLAAVAASIVLHGISVTPLMSLYASRQKTAKAAP